MTTVALVIITIDVILLLQVSSSLVDNLFHPTVLDYRTFPPSLLALSNLYVYVPPLLLVNPFCLFHRKR